ncbi:MAG: manganese efflux pump [Bacillota bacterium]|nr:manganese efflux pump [Bacillota bacterium]
MQYAAIVLLGIVANLDNMCLGLVFGLQRKHIPWVSNLVISLISGLAAFIPCFIGGLAGSTIRQWANLVGGLLLCAAGAWMFIAALRNGKKHTEKIAESAQSSPSGEDRRKRLNFRETVLLGFTLALNCIGLSLGAGVAGIDSGILAASMIVFSFMSIFFGNQIGLKNRLHVRLPQKLIELLSAVLVIGIGLYEIFV